MSLQGAVVAHVLVDTPVIDGGHRVAEAAGGAVHEVGTQADGHFVTGFIGTLEQHIDLLAVVLGHDTLVVGIGYRGVGREFLGTAADTDVILLQDTCLEELLQVVVVGVVLAQVGAPAAAAHVLLVHSLGTRNEGGLDFGQAGRSVQFQRCRGGDGDFTVLAAALGGNHDDTVGTFLTVECRSGSALQHRDVLNVIRVEVSKCRGSAADGHTVDNHQRLIALRVVHRRDGADDDLRRGVGRTAAGAYLQAGDFALQRVGEVGGAASGHRLLVKGLNSEVQFLFLLGLAHGGYHDLSQHLGIFIKGDVDD